MSVQPEWVALAWRLPAGARTPRVTTWRNLRRIGAARLTPGAALSHRGGRCTFEVLLETYALDDPALHRMAHVIHAADLPHDEPSTSLAPGVLAIFDGIRDGCASDDERLTCGFIVCDALYQYCTQDAGSDGDE